MLLPLYMRAFLVAVLVAGACSGRDGTVAEDHPDKKVVDSGQPQAAPEIAAKALGLPDVAAYGWRARAGQPAFREARRAEDKEDWPAVATACRKALAADPGHLEAAYLLAAALGAMGKLDEVAAPLAVAEAGDFGKWGAASLELPSLKAFLASPTGGAWKKRVESDRAQYAAALARSVVVESDGDLYAYDPQGPRYYRLTRTSGGVVGTLAVPGRHEIVYVTRSRMKKETHVGIGVVDLTTGHARRPADVTTGGGPIAVAPAPKGSVWVMQEKTGAAWLVDDAGKVAATKTPRPDGTWVEIYAHRARLHRIPREIAADFDERTLTSQMRLLPSKRVVQAPSPGLFDGSSITWTPDMSRLAVVAQLDEHCTGATQAAAFVVETSTGTLHEIERSPGAMAVEWATDRQLVVASDAGVTLYDLDAPKPVVLTGATGLVTPRRLPRCVPVDVEEPAGAGSGSGSGSADDSVEVVEP